MTDNADSQISPQLRGQLYSEEELKTFREHNCRQMQVPFLTFCLVSVSALLFLRVFILQFVNIMHSLALPSFLVLLFYYFRERNKTMANLNFYLLTILLPLVVLVVAQKTISQSPDTYHLNESFLSWLVLAISLCGISPLPWTQVAGIIAVNLSIFTLRLWSHYGLAKIRDDLYVHFISCLMVISIIVRAKEALDRAEFQNLMIIKVQARHWHQVLDQLEEGVLLIEQ